MKPFEIHDVRSAGEASELLAHYGETAKPYAGGTELLLVMKAGLLHYDHLINIKTIPGLNAIRYAEDQSMLKIGALATHRDIERSPVVQKHLSLLAELERSIANVRVRNVGTIGGNLSFAEPHSDPATLFMALGAQLKLGSSRGDRTLPIDEFIVDAYETALNQDELLTEIQIPLPSTRTGGGYQRFQFYERPAVSVAVWLTLDRAREGMEEVRITVGCVEPKPVRAIEAEAILQGKAIDEARSLIVEAGRKAAAAMHPIDDLNGSGEYKKHLVEVFVTRAFHQAYRI
ncbi:MAG: FAD binding domain-containing protein [Candidatus Bipolaricaulia bacterium]